MKIVKQHINSASSYKDFDITSINIGQTVAFDILIKKDNDYTIIIESGSIINDNLYSKLKKQDALYISNKDIFKQSLNPKTLKYYIRANISNPEKILSLLYDVNNQVFDEF